MKKWAEMARRWFEQAVHNVEATRVRVEKGFWSDACFMAEQNAQTALTAFLYGQGWRYIPIHSVAEPAAQAAAIDSTFTPVIEWGNVLDKYYIPARSPDAPAPPAVPYKSFTEAEARQALGYAEQIIALVQSGLS